MLSDEDAEGEEKTDFEGTGFGGAKEGAAVDFGVGVDDTGGRGAAFGEAGGLGVGDVCLPADEV